MKNSTALAPVPSVDRIPALDVLRGFALLGILLMNIQSFAMINAAYLNPQAFGDLTGVNLWVWVGSYVFADQKFISLFSLLFGAGILLLAQRAESQGRRAAGLHFRRTGWLLLIGLAHAYLVWHYSMFTGSQYNYWGSLFVALAYLAAIMLLVRLAILPRVQRGLAAVGRTALTNYLGQSLICTLVFYGHGLGLFGRLERYQQLLVVLAIWTLQITASTLWLCRFRYGPMEWLWRSLTYLRWQPMRLAPNPPLPMSEQASASMAK